MKKNLSNMSLVELEARLEELKAEARLVKSEIAAKKAGATLLDPVFLAAWNEALSLFRPIWEEWVKFDLSKKEFEALSMKEKAALVSAGLAPSTAREPKYILVKSEKGQDTEGWEDAANVLLSRWKSDFAVKQNIVIKMAVKK